MLALVAARIARAQDKAIAEACLEHSFQRRQLAARYPAADRDQIAAPAHQPRQLRKGGGARENVCGADQAFMQLLVRPFRAAARVFLLLFLGHARETSTQLPAHLVGPTVELGGNVHCSPAGGLEHALDFLRVSDRARNDHAHLFFAGEERDGDIAGQAERFLKTPDVGIGQRADTDIEQGAFLLQQCQIDAEILELVERPEQLGGMAKFFA